MQKWHSFEFQTIKFYTMRMGSCFSLISQTGEAETLEFQVVVYTLATALPIFAVCTENIC